MLAGVFGATVLFSGCAVVWTGHVTFRSSGFGADAPVPALAIADYMRDLEALTKQPAAQSDAALQAMATRPLPPAAGPALDLALLTRALAQRLRQDHAGLTQTRDMAWRRGTQREIVLHVLTLHAAALRTAGLPNAARDAFAAAERYMLDAARRSGTPVHRSEASRGFLQEVLFAARQLGDTTLGDRIVDQYFEPLLRDAAIEPPLKLIVRLVVDEYRITQRVSWGGGDPLAGHDALVALVAAHQDAVARLDGSTGRAARHKLMDLRLQAGHLALRAHRPSLAASQLRAVESADTDEAARRFAAGELRAAIALAGHEFERALAVMDGEWQQAPVFIRNLGVVRAGSGRSFVIADIPGVIEGAAEGAGLGIQFLKHLSRTRLLLHLVDIAPIDDASPADAVRCIEAEVGKFGHGLAERERWLVLTKRDLLDDDAFEDRRQGLIAALDWRGPVFAVSSVTRQGLDALIAALAAHLERLRKAERPDDPEDQPYDPVTT